MSEVRRGITTIVEQDEHQLVNQQRSQSTTCKRTFDRKASSFSHGDSFPGYIVQEETTNEEVNNCLNQPDSHHHPSGSSSRHVSSRKQIKNHPRKLITSKSTPSSFDYTLIDQEDYIFESNLIETPRAKSNSIVLLIIMILIYYSILFSILFHFHSTLVTRNNEKVSTNESVTLNTLHENYHHDTLVSPLNDDMIYDPSTGHSSHVDSTSMPTVTLDQSKVLTERDDHLINLASQLSDKNEHLIQLTDHSSPDQVTDVPRRSTTQYFDISLDDDDDRIHLHWLPDYKRKRIFFSLHLTLLTQHDWFAFGFSNDGNITLADICILWTDHKNQYHFEHAWTDEEGFITVESDDINDCQFSKLTQPSPSELQIQFTRKFDTCDDKNYIIKDGTTHLVYASGKGPVKRVDGIKLVHPSSPQLAIKYGFVRTRLLRPLTSFSPVSSHPDGSVEKVDIFANRTLIPAKETTYWCSLHSIPHHLTRSKHHIIGYEAIITSKSLVHHMEVFHCEVDATTSLTLRDEECKDSVKPRGLEKCSKVIAAWAMGADGIFYPPQAGLPVGGTSYSSYVMLEIHYNNPHHLENIVDSSGIRLYISSNVRTHDIGIMELGLEYIDKNSIPPKQEAFTLTGYCVSECTRIALPDTGIHIVASQLHTHLTGRRVITRHIRNGVELPEINRDDHYSQHFQEIRTLHHPITVLPGDSLITTCTYDTRDRINITLGGFAISQEMCVNYIHYYPKVQLEVCKSSIDDRFLEMFFRYMNTYEDETTDIIHKGYSDNFNSIHWSINNVNKLHLLYLNSPISMQCNKSDGQRFHGDWNGIAPTKIFSKLHSTRHCNNDHN